MSDIILLLLLALHCWHVAETKGGGKGGAAGGAMQFSSRENNFLGMPVLLLIIMAMMAVLCVCIAMCKFYGHYYRNEGEIPVHIPKRVDLNGDVETAVEAV